MPTASKNVIQERCGWCTADKLYTDYHDFEWGVPLHDETKLFELLSLEGMQAGLSWFTILRKREHFRQAFAHFDVDKVARYSEQKLAKLVTNPLIIRSVSKLQAIVKNAQAFIKVQNEWDTFDHYIWHFTDGKVIQNNWRKLEQVPAQTPLSLLIAKDLKQRGFSYIGPTICYAYMQAIGIVNDHLVNCFRHSELSS